MIDVKPWKTNQIAFFVNPEKYSIPTMIIYDTNNSEVDGIYKLTNKKALLSDVLVVVNGEQDLVLFEAFADKVELNLFDLKEKKTTWR